MKGEQGFSLIELIVSLSVGLILILSINAAVVNYTTLAKHSRSLVLANSYVEGKVESLRNSGYNALNIGTASLSNELPGGLTAPKTGQMVVSSPSAGIKKIDITITYNDSGTKTYNYSTYIGELGVGQ